MQQITVNTIQKQTYESEIPELAYNIKTHRYRRKTGHRVFETVFAALFVLGESLKRNFMS